MVEAPIKSSATAETPIKSAARRSRPGYLSAESLAGIFATLLLISGIWGAGWQPVHHDAYRLPSGPLSSDFWLYPHEDNAFRRLPVIRSDLNDVFVLPGSKQIWAVGSSGLIVHSSDGGSSWQQQEIVEEAQPAKTSDNGFGLFRPAWAGEPPDAKNFSKQTQQTTDLSGNAAANSAASAELKSQVPAIQPDQDKSGIPQANSLPPASQAPVAPKASLTNLNAVFFNDDRHGWAVGEHGVLLATGDGGDSWRPQTSGVNSELAGVHFSDDRHGWAVGGNGVILATGDGGNTWRKQTSGVAASLYGVHFIDTRQGWAVGSDGMMLATSDGGNTWQWHSSFVGSRLSSIYFSDSRHGWAVGTDGAILASSDGGQSWQWQSSGVRSRLMSVHFSDDRHGWVVGENGLILATRDGGNTWRRKTSGAGSGLAGVHFSDDRHGWAVGSHGELLATTDGGNTWQRQSRGIRLYLHGIHFSDDSHGWAVGYKGAILATTNGGQSWLRQASGVASNLYGVHFSDGLHGWAVGENDAILATGDGGQTWQSLDGGVNSKLIGVHFNDEQYGWAVGDEGVILATTDGGNTWKPQSSGVNSPIADIHFSDGLHGWAVGDEGVILATTDGGNTWKPQTSGVASSLYGVHFNDDMYGWAVGAKGVFLATVDGGKTWRLQASGVESAFLGVDFSDERRGWVVGDSGVIFATGDGGQTWQPQHSGVKSAIVDVHFSNGLHGWAVGDDGVILSTQDGGTTWRQPDYRRYPAPWSYLALLLAMALASLSVAWQLHQGLQAPSRKSVMDRAVTDKPAGPYTGGLDLLGARKLAMGLVRFLTNKNTLPPITLAVTGEWGSGKSSVMNFLFAGLKRQGLTPVWFNAWHHREEQNVLASMLVNIHKQVIGPWWAPGGFWFRLRLLWKRNLLVKLLLSTLAFTLMFSGFWLYKHEDGRNPLWQYASYQMGIFEPVMLSQSGHDALCQPSDAKALFNDEQCKLLQGLVSEAKQHQDVLKCSDSASGHCFSRPQLMIEAVEGALNVQLTVENEATVIKALEHLHPDFPLPLPPAAATWLSAAVAVLGFLTVKGMTLVGLAPAKVVQSVLSMAGTAASPPNEPVGTRVLFEKHFQRITEVLGTRRLVLFIDDLDRCDREHTRQVLEITNFLSSASDLFIVLGMAPRYVLANVTLSFQDMAKAVHEADVSNGEAAEGPGRQHAGQSWYARHYLQKLIHIEVPVPTPEKAQVLALLRGDSAQDGRDAEDIKLEKLEQAELRLDRFLVWLGRGITTLLLLAALISGGLWGAGEWQPAWFTEQAAKEKPKPIAAGGPVTPAPLQNIESSEQPEPADTRSSGNGFFAGAALANDPLWQLWPFALLASSLAGLVLLARQPKILDKRWLSWLQPLYQRLKLQIVGAELREDSQTFADALEIWYELIALSNPIPRNVKAFLNQLRYFASREFGGENEEKREAQWVALAVAFYAFDDDMDKVFAVQKDKDGRRWHFLDKDFERKLRERGMENALISALDAHHLQFHEFPEQTDTAQFKEFCQEISIQKREPR